MNPKSGDKSIVKKKKGEFQGKHHYKGKIQI